MDPGNSNPQKFDPTDTSTVSNRWKKWKRCFEIFLDVQNVTIPERKRSYLLHYAGSDVQDIYFNLKGEAELEVPEDSNVYKEAVQLLDNYFLPLKCLPRERHIFRNLEQASDKSIEKFVLRLREQGSLCDYGDWLEENIKEQIFERGYSDELRAKILTKGDITLAQTVEIGRSLETIAKHRRNLQKQEEINRIARQGECFRCGHEGHYANDEECPARDQECEKCHLIGHYERCCKTKTKNTRKKKFAGKEKRRKSKVRQVVSDDSVTEEDQDSTSDEEEPLNYVFATNPDQSDLAKCKIGGVKLSWTIDSGAGVNVISSDTWEFLKDRNVKVDYQTNQVSKSLVAYGNNKLAVKGMFVAEIATKKSSIIDKVYVVHEGGSNLLGRKAAVKLGILKIDTSICAVESSEEKIGKVKDVVVTVQLNPTVKPIQHTQSRVPIPLQLKVEKEINKLLQQDIIETAPRDSPWISRLVVRPKGANSEEVRLCVDMRDANKAIIPQHHPLPTFDDIIPHLNNCKVFSKIDLNKAFHQIELAEESRGITTFASHNGYFRYKRLTFGMNCASEVFQNVIERVLAGIPGVKVFIDDMLVYGRDREEHDRALVMVLKRLKEYGITINKRKCEFGRSQVTFMGHRLDGNGISPSEEKVDSIRRFRCPENVEEVRSFLGLANYLGKFIPNLSTLTAPLRELLHKNVRFKWIPEHTEAFDKVKEALADPRNLGYYSPYDETIVIADASPVGLGAVLLQVKDGQKRPICYISKGLSSAERGYAQNEREALALVWAVERLEPYLRGLEFKLVTDHEPLKVIFNSKRKQCSRIERWALRLQSFRFQIVHVSGKANIADPLSRLPKFQDCTTYDRKGETLLLAVLEAARPTALSLNEIVEETVKDVHLAAVKEALHTGKWSDELKKYYPFREELSESNEIVLRNDRIVVPVNLRQRVLSLAHIGHPGIERTKQRLRSKVWWPNVDKDAEKMVKSCLDCQLVTGSVTPEAMNVRELPQQPWHVLAMDILGPLPSGDSILVVIDLYSRYRVIEILRSTTTEDIVGRLDQTFMRLGIPGLLIADNARNFSSQKMQDFCRLNGIELRHTTPYWPQANGEVERQNRSILKILRISALNGTDWRKDLQQANYVYLLTKHPATGRSPAEVAFGRRFRDWIPQIPLTNEDDEIRDNDKVYKNMAKKYFDSHHATHQLDLQPQDRVLMRNLLPQNKLAPLYHADPAKVIQTKGNSVVVETSDGRRYRRNSAHLKKLHHGNENEEEQQCVTMEENSSAGPEAEWATPLSTSRLESSTPIVNDENQQRRETLGRPKRATRRPLRYEDFDLE
ncbi:uncharacterized protein K02A2.6-like [Uranotaenia lowii]|uniref:uncharacterized protein K02A2.6-like n=1 Tax=Uranotaenia lowii TaxID=190385 RepID=UPI002479EBD0|nr:uncharacterized protein K02A2.6-like [Uranotaenia lowii]